MMDIRHEAWLYNGGKNNEQKNKYSLNNITTVLKSLHTIVRINRPYLELLKIKTFRVTKPRLYIFIVNNE